MEEFAYDQLFEFFDYLTETGTEVARRSMRAKEFLFAHRSVFDRKPPRPQSDTTADNLLVVANIADAFGNQLNFDNRINTEKIANFVATRPTTEEKTMPTKYADGSFRIKNANTGLLEYRFMFNGEQKSTCGMTKQICFDERTLLISGKKKSKKSKKEVPTVVEYFRNYYKTYKITKEGKKINPTNERIIEAVLLPEFEKTPITQFTTSMAKILLKEYDDRPNRRKKIYTFMKEVFELAAADDTIKKNPMRAIKLDKYMVNSFNVIQPAQFNAIIKHIDNEAYLHFFWYLCCTGLRLDTAMQSIHTIDLDRNVIRVTKADTVTKRHRAEIPFLPGFLDERKIALLKTVVYDKVERYFQNLYNELGFDLVLHSCRKCFASCAYHVGFSVKWIQNKLRHSTANMTMNTYVELYDTEKSPIVDYFRQLKEHLKL